MFGFDFEIFCISHNYSGHRMVSMVSYCNIAKSYLHINPVIYIQLKSYAYNIELYA